MERLREISIALLNAGIEKRSSFSANEKRSGKDYFFVQPIVVEAALMSSSQSSQNLRRALLPVSLQFRLERSANLDDPLSIFTANRFTSQCLHFGIRFSN